MQVATALAVSWKPLTNSKPSAMSRATPSKMKGNTEERVDNGEVIGQLGSDVDETANQHNAEDDSADFAGRRLLEFFVK